MHKMSGPLHNMSNLLFLTSGNYQNYSMKLDKHLRGYYTIQYACAGELHVAYDEQFYFLNSQETGWFFPAYPGPRFRFHPSEPEETWWHRYIAFQGELVNQWRASGLWPTEPQPAPEGLDGGALLDAIVAQTQEKSRWSHEKAVNQLEALLLDLAAARTTPLAGTPWLSKVLEHLGSSFSPHYPNLATHLGCSLATLRRRFKQETGQTLHEYIIAQRITRARALLIETNLPLREIAHQLGYDSEFFFARQFKQIAQVTPGEYRRSGLFIPP